jgi:hypothetical protein
MAWFILIMPVPTFSTRPIRCIKPKSKKLRGMLFIWVDFHFKDIPGSAIGLLKLSLDGVERITSQVRKWL